MTGAREEQATGEHAEKTPSHDWSSPTAWRTFSFGVTLSTVPADGGVVDVEVIEVQPVAQLCGSAGYAAWRDGVERAWRRQKGRWSTAAWPRTLDADHVAVLLLPLPSGRVGQAARHASPVADPVFTAGVPLVEVPDTDPALDLLLTWTLADAADW